MSDPPAALVGQAGWAKEAISHVKGAHGMNDSLLWSQKCLGTSSMFSGAVFPERALAFLDAARKMHAAGIGELSATRSTDSALGCKSVSSLGFTL